MSKHHLYAVDVKRELTIYQRVHIAVPDSIPEDAHGAHIRDLIEYMDARGDVCDTDDCDEMDSGDVEIVEIDEFADGPWSLDDTESYATNVHGDVEEHVTRVVTE